MSKFTRIAPRHARSDEGFEVKFPGLEKLLYSENASSDGKRSVSIPIETLMGAVNCDLFVGEAFLHHWDPPHSHEALHAKEKHRIIKNVTEALDFLGITYMLSK